MSQLSNALSNILIRRLDQKLSCFEVQNYHCQSASLRSIKCMFCKVGIIDLGILSTSKIWEHVEISEDVEISEHVEISDHEEMSYTLFVFVIIHEKFLFCFDFYVFRNFWVDRNF